jgi:hypothetical protein
MKARWLIGPEVSLFPEKMGAGECGVTAQIDLNCRREPPQSKTAVAREQKCGFRQIHLAGHKLHPGILAGLLQQAHGRRVSRERPLRESVYLRDRQAHVLPSRQSSRPAMKSNRK